jgi:oligopeptide/dipeptide ABC transporter ATP-binding protein
VSTQPADAQNTTSGLERLAGQQAPLVQITGLRAVAETSRGRAEILRGIDLVIPAEARVGLVGESGSGKSMTASALIGLLPKTVKLTGGEILFQGRDLTNLSEGQMRRVRGHEISIVYQNATASLNPLEQVGDQIALVCRAHRDVGMAEARRRAVELLDSLGVPDATRRAKSYPHQFSGGMAQRVAIAMALICGPKLLIADEPTTGLDATIQAQVLEVIRESVARSQAALLLISHDLGVIESMCDVVAVMYAGTVLEIGRTQDVMRTPLSPYTQALVKIVDASSREITYIPGRVPEPWKLHNQCPFDDRCPLVSEVCHRVVPTLRELRPNHWVACHNAA